MTGTNPAPYPTSSAEVTAENLARHLTVQAQRTNLKVQNAADLDRNMMVRFIYEFGCAFLLREARACLGPVDADEIARQLWEIWNDGSLGEFLHEWLTECGIDPEQVKP